MHIQTSMYNFMQIRDNSKRKSKNKTKTYPKGRKLWLIRQSPVLTCVIRDKDGLLKTHYN